MERPRFSVNQYDSDGDLIDTGVFLRVGTTILKFENRKELENFRDGVTRCINEIKEEYPEA